MTHATLTSALDEQSEAIKLLVEQVKVLISAIDDLRCEIEWQARNGNLPESSETASSPADENEATEPEQVEQGAELNVAADESLLSAVGRLRAYERALSHGRRTAWRDEWATADDFEIPAGRLVSVSDDLWRTVLEFRPVHVIGDGCCCEEGIGAPYLLAWQSGDEFLIRELADEEALKLQELCLAAQAEESPQRALAPAAATDQAQLGLF